MNVTDYVPLVDTTRAELRQRIAAARDEFDRLIRSADPHARSRGSDWTVQQLAAHVLTVAHRYRDFARDGAYRRAATAAELALINQADLEAAMAPVSELADQLNALAPELDSFFDAVAGEPATLPFHARGVIDGVTAQTNWLGELLLHGHDVARAARVPWPLPERDMLLVARGAMQIAPAYLCAGLSPGTDICVVMQTPGGRPYLTHVHHGTVEARPRRSDDRPDAVLRLPASTLTQLLYQRVGPVAAVGRGLRIVGGRRPWLAGKLMSCFERP